MGSAPSCKINKNLEGQVILITGANSGIGRETARRMASLGATIILACRSEEKTTPLIKELKQTYTRGQYHFIKCELDNLDSVVECTNQIKQKFVKIDILLNNAGVMMPQKKMVTKQNYELQIGTNHFGHFVLTNLLLPLIKQSPSARIINVSSLGHEEMLGEKGDIHFDDLNYNNNKYTPPGSYAQSKLANILFTVQLQQVLDSQKCNIKCVCLHPGVIDTGLQRHLRKDGNCFVKCYMKCWSLSAMTPEQGAQTNIYLCLEDHDKLIKTAYYWDLKPKKPSKKAQDKQLAAKFWEFSNQEMQKYIQSW